MHRPIGRYRPTCDFEGAYFIGKGGEEGREGRARMGRRERGGPTFMARGGRGRGGEEKGGEGRGGER